MRLPEPVILVTAGIDVQQKYIIQLTTGWSETCEAWVLEWDTIEGDPRDPAVFRSLANTLHAMRYEHPTAGDVPIHLAGIDSGYLTEDVYRGVRQANMLPGRAGKWVYATKGIGGREADPIVLPILDSRKGGGRWNRPLPLNADAAKAELFAMLNTQSPGRGYFHIPKRVGADFVKQLTSEEQRPRFDGDGAIVGHEWKKRSYDIRNEALDCAVINLCLFHYAHKRQWLDLLIKRYGTDEGCKRWQELYPGEEIYGRARPAAARQ